VARELSEKQKAALRKGNPKAFTRKPAGGGGGQPPRKSDSRKRASVRAGAPPANPKQRKPRETSKREPEQEKSRPGGFWRGLLDL
jgi:hypothetical protein